MKLIEYWGIVVNVYNLEISLIVVIFCLGRLELISIVFMWNKFNLMKGIKLNYLILLKMNI